MKTSVPLLVAAAVTVALLAGCFLLKQRTQRAAVRREAEDGICLLEAYLIEQARRGLACLVFPHLRLRQVPGYQKMPAPFREPAAHPPERRAHHV
jgi:hypothetical protein